MEVTLLSDNVLVERLDHNDEDYFMHGGFFIPSNKENQGKANEGYVLAIGPGRIGKTTGMLLPMEVRIGDKVVFENHMKENVKIEGKEYIVLKEENIVGIIEQ